jgi:hypothetical protein
VRSDAVRDRHAVASVSPEGLWPSPNDRTTPFRIEPRLEALLSTCFSGGRFAVQLASIHRALPCAPETRWFQRVPPETRAVMATGFRTLPRLSAPRISGESLGSDRIGSGFRNAAGLAAFPTHDLTSQALSNKGLQQTWRSLALAPRS